MTTMYSQNEAQLLAIGQRLGLLLEKGDILILTGQLGAGKTTLTKGIAKGLGIEQMVKSPTYTIARQYQGRLLLNHLDVYRLGQDPDSIDLDDFLFGDGVTVIEWGSLLVQDLPDDYLEIRIDQAGDGRLLSFEGFGPRSKALAKELEAHG